MNIKAFFSDIDGTLLDENRSISKQTKEALERFPNWPKILISSRQPSGMYYLQNMLGILGSPIIAYNGALILDDQDLLYSISIPDEISRKALEFGQDKGLHVSHYFNDKWIAPFDDFWSKREQNNTKVEPEVMPYPKILNPEKPRDLSAHKLMGMGDAEKIDGLIDFLENTFPGKLHLYRSKDTYVEISPKTISKKTAIEFLLKHKYPTIDLKDCIAFGDNYNDIEMLQAVGTGVAVDNARTEVKEIANHQTLSNKDHGVAHFLNNILS